MKKISKVLLIGAAVMMLVLPLSAAKRDGVDPASKYKNLFVFKAERKLVGGKVEILSADGEVVAVQTMQKRKLFINFSNVADGVYIIRVSKGGTIKEFQFRK